MSNYDIWNAETSDGDTIGVPGVSSSPMKMAGTSKSMTNVSPANAYFSALTTYVAKYCDITTGGRVVFQGAYQAAATAGSWLRFKCMWCQDNWNMGAHLFKDVTSCPTGCPTELTDWLVLHKHICSKFKMKGQTTGINGVVTNPKCLSCGWAWNQHKEAQPVFNDSSGVWEGKNVTESTAWKEQKQKQSLPMDKGQTIEYYDFISMHNSKVNTPFVIHGGEAIVSVSSNKNKTLFCVACEMEITSGGLRADGHGLCQVCLDAVKQVHEMKAKTKTTTEGRMFRQKKEGDRCELPEATRETTSPGFSQ